VAVQVLVVPALLASGLAACRAATPAPTTGAPPDQRVATTGGVTTGTAATPGATAVATAAVGLTPTTAATASGPTATIDPTREAFYNSFELPVMGAENAPVTLFEFSDYL
jgi:hypothetical protein